MGLGLIFVPTLLGILLDTRDCRGDACISFA
jgi:hypothetical protein